MSYPAAHGYSIASESHPKRNEDSYFIASSGAIGVFDGLGGHPGSQLASQVAARVCQEYLEDYTAAQTPYDAAQHLFTALIEANSAIRHEQERGKLGIATTAILAQVFFDENAGNYVQFAYSGDSRGYVLRDTTYTYVSIDHAASTKNLPIADQRRIQRHLGAVYRQDQVDPYEWPHLYQRNVIAHCLDGFAEPHITLDTVPLMSGDKLLLTSDGIHDNLTLKEIRSTLASHSLAAPEELVAQALERSKEPRRGEIEVEGEIFEVEYIRPKSDDMTAVVRMF